MGVCEVIVVVGGRWLSMVMSMGLAFETASVAAALV